MHAAQFVNELAVIIGKDAAWLRVIDRSLSEAGLRKKGRGKTLPNVCTEEGVRLLLAVLGGRVAIRSAENARDLSWFELHVHQTANDLSLLAEAIAIPVPQLGSMSLEQILCLICSRLAIGEISRNDLIELKVEQGSLVTIEMKLGDIKGEVSFSGVTTPAGSNNFREHRVVNQNVLRWIGENTVSDQG